MAVARHVSRPSRPKRSDSACQPPTAPGTVTDRGPSASTGPSGAAEAGAGPAASRPATSPARQTIANASPPRPVDIGSGADGTAPPAMAPAAAVPPRPSLRTPGRGGHGVAPGAPAGRATAAGAPPP